MQLQLHYTNYTTPQLQLHYTTTTTTSALHHTTSSSCGWGDRPGDHCNHCSHSKKHNSNHLAVHQWIRSAIRDSQQPISPIGFLFLKLPPPPCAVLLVYCRRKFRSQTSDNMDGWKSRGGKSQRREEKKEDQRIEKVRGKKMQVREKVEKSRNTIFFQCFVSPEDRKVGSLKRRTRSHLARWEMKNCTPLWREAYFEVKTYKEHHSRSTFGSWDDESVHAIVAQSIFRSQTYKAHHSRSTSGSWDDEKVHAVVARSIFRSQNLQSTPFSEHFWKLRWWENARRCGAKHISKSKCKKHTRFGALLEVEMLKNCRPLWREAHVEVKM